MSSDWEAFYLQNAQALFEAGLCKSMEQNVTLIDTWLRDIGRTWDESQPISDAVLEPLRSTAVWSQLEYRDSCSGATFSQPIEPLVGLMRWVQWCRSSNPRASDPAMLPCCGGWMSLWRCRGRLSTAV